MSTDARLSFAFSLLSPRLFYLSYLVPMFPLMLSRTVSHQGHPRERPFNELTARRSVSKLHAHYLPVSIDDYPRVYGLLFQRKRRRSFPVDTSRRDVVVESWRLHNRITLSRISHAFPTSLIYLHRRVGIRYIPEESRLGEHRIFD